MLKKILMMAAVLASSVASTASAGAPAKASSAPVPIFGSHGALNSNTALKDDTGAEVAAVTIGYDNQFGTCCNPVGLFYSKYLSSNVSYANCWPFTDCRYDRDYNGYAVFQIIQANGVGGCMLTDGIHSGVLDNGCGTHNANSYWIGNGNKFGAPVTGACGSGGEWLINVGLTTHYDPYPYGYVNFVNTDGNLYATAVEQQNYADGDDQWCYQTV